MLSKDTDSDFLIIIIVSIGIILLFITTVISLVYLSHRRYLRYQYDKQLLEQNYEKEKLKAEIEIQEQTFTLLSEEIHDNIGQSLSLVKLNLNMGNAAQIQQAKDILTTSIQDLRNLAQSLNTENFKSKGLIPSIKKEIYRLQQTQIYNIHFLMSVDDEEIIMDNQMLIFRIFQESINNILKHAFAKNIIVKMALGNQQFSLEIIDDGVGFDMSKTDDGIGLMNMKKRMLLIGGEISINSSSGNGTHLTFMVDLNKTLIRKNGNNNSFS